MRFFFSYLFALSTLFSFSQGYYLEFKISGSALMDGSMKVYAQNGVSRSEIVLSNEDAKKIMPNGMAVLFKEETPTVSYLLNPSEKKYSEIKLANSNEWRDYNKEDYEITVLGKEKINGYNTTHVKIKVKSEGFTQELWLSKDLADYAIFSKIKTQYTGKDNLYKALQAKNVEGFPVKILMEQKGVNMEIELVKAEKKALAASLFSLDGYSKASLFSNFMDIDFSELQDSDNLSVEEKQRMMNKMLKEMRKNLPEGVK